MIQCRQVLTGTRMSFILFFWCSVVVCDVFTCIPFLSSYFQNVGFIQLSYIWRYSIYLQKSRTAIEEISVQIKIWWCPIVYEPIVYELQFTRGVQVLDSWRVVRSSSKFFGPSNKFSRYLISNDFGFLATTYVSSFVCSFCHILRGFRSFINDFGFLARYDIRSFALDSFEILDLIRSMTFLIWELCLGCWTELTTQSHA